MIGNVGGAVGGGGTTLCGVGVSVAGSGVIGGGGGSGDVGAGIGVGGMNGTGDGGLATLGMKSRRRRERTGRRIDDRAVRALRLLRRHRDERQLHRRCCRQIAGGCTALDRRARIRRYARLQRNDRQ